MSEREWKTVRLRKGVHAYGQPVVPGWSGSRSRTLHLVSASWELDGLDGVTACCGAWFAPDTLEEVPWGRLWPHNVCVMRSRWSRRVLEASFAAVELSVGVQSTEELTASFEVVDRLMDGRSDWVDDKKDGDWEYTASFNGTLLGEARFSRGRDLGLEPLTAELVHVGVFRIHSCGVREGCKKHATTSETFSLDELWLIKKRLAVYEVLATSIDLQELSWCLIIGECSRTETDTMF